jgi:hypothetical protein
MRRIINILGKGISMKTSDRRLPNGYLSLRDNPQELQIRLAVWEANPMIRMHELF